MTAPLPSRRPAARTLAQGADWSAWEFRCTLGPRDRPFEERHDCVSIAAVVDGTFLYRGATGRALLHPGAFLLGNAGTCFECGHEHGTGDRCIAFGFAPALFEEIAATAAGSSRFRFATPMLPALASTAGVRLDATLCAAGATALAVEAVAVAVAERVVRSASGFTPVPRAPSARDERRISDVLRVIEQRVDDALDLARLAAIARMSKYHFLRTFRRVAGMTPHRYLLDARLARSALRLRSGTLPVSAIAADAGFGDLSTFHQRFRTVFGTSPHALRQRTLASAAGTPRSTSRARPASRPSGSDPRWQ